MSTAKADLLDDIGSRELTSRLGDRTPLPLKTYVARRESGWKFRKGLSEPTPDPNEWRSAGYVPDATWDDATLPIGYGDNDDTTELNDMRRSYQSVYLRKDFTLPDQPPAAVLLRLYVDDGAVIWINGIEIARRHVGEGNLPHNATATNHEADWENILLSNADEFLVVGENVVAVHAINQSATSSDFSFDLELLSPRVTVAQVEATMEVETPAGSGNFEEYFLPQTYPSAEPMAVDMEIPFLGQTFAGAGEFLGTQIRVQTVDPSVSYSISSHARTVGVNIYGTGSSFPDLAEVDCYSAGDWVERILGKRSNFSPKSTPSWIQNHSWVQTSDEEDSAEEIEEALLRIDYAAERDSVLPIVGLNNGSNTTVPPLMATAFNVISVGKTDGAHSRGGTDSIYVQPGRTKPELVAPHFATSYATAAVSSAAAFLVDEILRDVDAYEMALRPEVMKSILLAGATQDEFPQWSRTPESPLDSVYGAGELNLSRSHHILTHGKLQSPIASPRVIAGWTAAHVTADGTTEIQLQIPNDLAVTKLNAALCWNRNVTNTSTNGGFTPQPALPDMTLTLKSSSAADEPIDTSTAPIGNIEYLRSEIRLNSGSYVFEVSSDLTSAFGLSWIGETEQAQVPPPQPVPVPRLRLVIDGEHLRVMASELILGKTYRLEKSPNLTSWENIIEFEVEDQEDTFDLGLAPRDTTFYRLLLLSSEPPSPEQQVGAGTPQFVPN